MFKFLHASDLHLDSPMRGLERYDGAPVDQIRGATRRAAAGHPGHEPYAPCSVDGLLCKNYDYWALGHVHQREILHENPWIVFPGNTQGRHVNESGPKGCEVVTVQEGCHTDIEHRGPGCCSLDSLRC